jgi:hypothetical protein
MAGVAISHTDGETELEQDTDNSAHDSYLVSIYPYMHWTPTDRISAWATLGYGEGHNEITEAGMRAEHSLRMQMAALGVSAELLRYSNGGVSIKGDGFIVEMSSGNAQGGGNALTRFDTEVHRYRVALEGHKRWKLNKASSIDMRLELGGRVDQSQDIEDGAGADLGGELGYRNQYMSIIARGHWLLSHEASAFEEWGGSIKINFRESETGRGFSFSVSPSWGRTDRADVGGLWGSEASSSSRGGIGLSSLTPERLALKLSYGLQTRGIEWLHYGELDMQDRDTHALRLGTRMKMLEALSLDIFGERRRQELEDKPNASYGVGVEGLVNF